MYSPLTKYLKPFIYLFLFFYTILILPLAASEKFYRWELSIVAIFKNDAPYLKEWIEFHKLVGVDHFWLYDNGSTDNFQEVLAPYIKSGTVELIPWPKQTPNIVQWNQLQCKAYNDGLKRSKTLSRWVAFMDTDEFLFSPHTDSVPQVLKRFKKKGAVGVNWVGFGTSDIQKLSPEKPMIEQLIMRADLLDPWHFHVKSIVNPRKAIKTVNPHHFELIFEEKTVNTQKISFYGPFSPLIDHSELRINHYWTRDEDFLHNRKIPLGLHWGHNRDQILKRAEILNRYPDDAILRFLPRLKERLGL